MSNEFRMTDYLARIGFRGTAEPNLPTLSALHDAHVDAIAFENIRVFTPCVFLNKAAIGLRVMEIP